MTKITTSGPAHLPPLLAREVGGRVHPGAVRMPRLGKEQWQSSLGDLDEGRTKGGWQLAGPS